MKKEKIDYKKERRLKKRLEKLADNLWHQAGISKWTNICFFENSEKKAKNHQKLTSYCHHYFRKGLYPILRYEINNAVPLCWACHYRLEKVDNTMLVDIRNKRGEKWYKDLIKKSQEKKFSFETIKWYNENIKKLNQWRVKLNKN